MSEAFNGAWDRLAGRASEMREMRVSDMRIDMRFQRAINPHSLDRIKAEYHPQGIGHILVADVKPVVDGEPVYAVIDGQTRWQAIRDLLTDQKDGKDVPAGLRPTIMAEVFPDLTPAEAALLFRLRNTQKPVPPKDRARVSVVEGDPEMMAVVEQASDAGYVVFSDDENVLETLPRQAIETARRIVQWGERHKRPHLLIEALSVQAEAFRVPESADLRGTIHPQILQATADLLRKNPNIVETELARSMRTMNDLLFDSEKLAQRDGVRMHKAIQVVLRNRYNKGKAKADVIVV